MQAHDMMTPDVATVSPEATVSEVASLLLDRGISAVPVVDQTGAVVGIVSEGDLLRRRELGTDKRRRGWRAWLSDPDAMAVEYVKSRSTHVRDIMSAPVLSVGPATPVSEIAGMMEKHRIKRVPVIDRGRLVGLVSRADLVRALARMPARSSALPNDSAIRNTVLQRLASQHFVSPGLVDVEVHDRKVTLSGTVSSDEQLQALRVMAESVPGVAAVESRIAVHPRLPLGL